LGGPKKKRPITKRKPKRKVDVKKTELQKTVREVVITDKLAIQIEKEALKMNYVTPYVIATKYNIRVSLAKNILKNLSKKGVIEKVSSNRRTILYAPIKSEKILN